MGGGLGGTCSRRSGRRAAAGRAASGLQGGLSRGAPVPRPDLGVCVLLIYSSFFCSRVRRGGIRSGRIGVRDRAGTAARRRIMVHAAPTAVARGGHEVARERVSAREGEGGGGRKYEFIMVRAARAPLPLPLHPPCCVAHERKKITTTKKSTIDTHTKGPVEGPAATAEMTGASAGVDERARGTWVAAWRRTWCGAAHAPTATV